MGLIGFWFIVAMIFLYCIFWSLDENWVKQRKRGGDHSKADLIARLKRKKAMREE